jgi:predicted nucleic acid-binding protein
MLLDTNIVIHACQPGGEWLSEWTDAQSASIASVTRLEALGFRGITKEEEAALRAFLDNTICHVLDDPVIEQAVSLRQSTRIGVMDAIIAATAQTQDLPLVTRNVEDFKNVQNLRLINPFDARGFKS